MNKRKEKLKACFCGLKTFNVRLFFALCALALFPAVYQTVKTGLLASNSFSFLFSETSSGGQSAVFDIIGQMEWFDLINETLQAFLIVPLYSVLNKIFKAEETIENSALPSEKTFASSAFKVGFAALALYTLFSVGVLVYGARLTAKMNPEGADLQVANRYLRMETAAFMLGVLVDFFNVIFVVTGNRKNIYVFLGIKIVLSLFADFLLIPRFGVYGVAASNIAVNALLSLACFLLLFKQGYIKPDGLKKSDVPMLKEWAKTGFFSGAQQFIDNFIYALMVCKMVNAVSEQGNYWVANNFIWGWLLIPVSALSEVIRRDCKDGAANLKRFNYFFVTAVSIAVWLVSLPFWKPFYRTAEGLENADEIFSITVKLAPFYIAYAGSAVFDNIFIGLGKTWYTALNSCIVNFAYYGAFYALYRTGALAFTMDTIILMFGFGMVVHLMISALQDVYFRRKSQKIVEIRA